MNKLAVTIVVIALVLVAGYFLMQSKNNPYSTTGTYQQPIVKNSYQNSNQSQDLNGPVSEDVNAELNKMEQSMDQASPEDFNQNLDPNNL
ncbi:hypothetical protein HY025_05970 [Candidatus Daviesbacteria bacterium]|nr:hypothetical protein [Candidatus Daviesbacteria bacterium]